MRFYKQAASLLLSAMISITMLTPAFAADAVTNGSMSIGGAKATISTITMTPGRTLEVLVANDTIDSHESGKSMVSGSNGSVVAAVNGGFFSLADWSVCNTMLQDGKMIAGGGWSNAVGITYDGEVLMDKVQFNGCATIQKPAREPYQVHSWSINRVGKGNEACVSLLNEYCRRGQKVPNGGIAFLVENGVVSNVISSGGLDPKEGQDIIVYNAAAIENTKKWNTLPAVGDKVVIGFVANPQKAGTQEKWQNAKSVMGGAAALVLDGKDVSYSNGLKAADQTPTSVRQRVFVAKMPNNELIMGTVYSSYAQIARSMIAAGATDVIAMDGGSSSMLYSDGSYLRSAGRQLTMGLAVVDQSPNLTRPANTAVPTAVTKPKGEDFTEQDLADMQSLVEFGELASINLNQILEENQQIEEQGMTQEVVPEANLPVQIPETVSRSENEFVFSQNPTQKEFYNTLIQCMEKRAGKSVTELANTSDPMEALRQLGILQGSVEAPMISRREAAVAVYKAHSIATKNSSSAYYSYLDCGDLSEEEQFAISYVSGYGLMTGNSNLFDPAVALSGKDLQQIANNF